MNHLWVSSLLPEKFPLIFKDITSILSGRNISIKQIYGTKDIWCRDYLPVPDSKGGYVQFRFDPGYLKYKKYSRLKSDPAFLYDQLKIFPRQSELVLDGGNVIMYGRTLILSEIVKKDNPTWSAEDIISELKDTLKAERVIIIPKQPNDFTGHADGMVRLIDEQHVLVNDYSKENERFRNRLNSSLKKAGLVQIPLSYGMDYSDKNTKSAVGTYINFLEINNIILLPSFRIKEDSKALSEIQGLYPRHNVYQIECRSLAGEGGVLNCIGWGNKQIT